MIRRAFFAACCATTVFSIAGCGGNHGTSERGDVSRSPAMESAGAPAPLSKRVESTKSSAVADSAAESAGFGGSPSSVTSKHSPAPDVAGAATAGATEEVETPFVPSNGRQSGVLTAGSFDDVAKFDDYLSFLRRHQHHARQCQVPVECSSEQTVIAVTDSEGRPIGDVRCVVQQANGGQAKRVLLDRSTGSDGRVMLLSDASARHSQQAQPLHLQVFLPGQQEPVVDEFRPAERCWSVTLQGVQSTLPKQLDLALVVDTTGSMGDELEYLKTEIDSIVASVKRMFPDIDQRFALITYRDNGDEYVCRTYDFTGSLSDFRRNLDAQSASGGGDFPEAMDVALQSASQLTWRNSQTARVLFLVGDAPPHSDKHAATMAAITGLSQQGVRIFPVGASGVEQTAEVILRTASLLSMGQYLFLTDHSGVGNAHATPDVPEFAVERLDRLMLRMIASELAGKRLVAQEVIAIERGERYSYAPPIRCQPPVPCPTPLQCYVGVPQSTFHIVTEWFHNNVLTTLVAVVSCAIVFERLTSFMSTPQA